MSAMRVGRMPGMICRPAHSRGVLPRFSLPRLRPNRGWDILFQIVSLYQVALQGDTFLKPRDITRTIIGLLEERSGYPVQISAEPNLPTIATVRIARGTLPAHLVLYKPSTGENPDYAICWQCVIAMRLFECPPNQRFQIASSRKGEQAVTALLNAPGGLAQQYQLCF